MNWLDQTVSLYSCATDNVGRPATLRYNLFTAPGRDIETIIQIKELSNHPDDQQKKNQLKQKIQAHTPAALLKCRRNTEENIIHRTNLFCADIDHITPPELEDIKQWIF